MNQGTVIICPICLDEGKKISLGSVDLKGMLYVRRFHDTGGTTIIYSEAMTIMHHCGFGTTINKSNTKIVPLSSY